MPPPPPPVILGVALLRHTSRSRASVRVMAERLSGFTKQPAVLVQHAALLLSAVRSYECQEACYPPIKL